jgi:thiol-disulfide isomerase/thioredoxin
MKQVLYFTAQWCTACQGMTPIVEQLKKTKVIPVEKIDTDYDVTLTEQYKVTCYEPITRHTIWANSSSIHLYPVARPI